jgi:hypothetical protein
MDYKQVEKRMNDEIDRLSNLPDDLIHRILSFVGIKCAIKLSALSSRWRYIWTSMPYLDFSVKNFGGSISLSKFVTNFLSRRNNLVEVVSIKLHSYRDFSSRSLRQIVSYASSHNIQQLDIVYFLSDSIKFPLTLIRSESLKHLSFKKEPETWYSKDSKRSVLALMSTLELPALATLYLHDTTLCCDGNADINSDTNIGLFSKCTNLKTLTLKSCKVTGLNRLNICHPLLYNLTVEDVQGSFNVVNVVAPQLKNLTIDNGLKKYQYLISAPGLVSLLYKGHHCLDLSTDGIHLLEKADLCVTGNASGSGSNKGRGSGSGSNRGRGRGIANESNRGRRRGSASGSVSNRVSYMLSFHFFVTMLFCYIYILINTPILQNVLYMLFDDDNLVDVQLEQANTEDMNVDAIKQDDGIKDTAAHANEETTAPVNDDTLAQVIEDTTPHANEDTTAQVNEDTTANVVPANEYEARLKRRYDDFWQGQ